MGNKEEVYKIKVVRETACVMLVNNNSGEYIDSLFINKIEFDDMNEQDIKEYADELAKRNEIYGYVFNIDGDERIVLL